MRNLEIGAKVMPSLEYYLKTNTLFITPSCGKVIDVNGRVVTIVDGYGHTWNIDSAFLEEDKVDSVEIKHADNFNTQIVKNFVQTFQNEGDVREIDKKVEKYLKSRLNPYGSEFGKILDVMRSVEKYREIEYNSKEAANLEAVDAKIEYIFEYLTAYIEQKGMDDTNSEISVQRENSDAGTRENGPVNPLDYLTDMTKVAKTKPYDNAYGREKEIKEVMRVVKHRDKRNAILVGKQGCGKTTIMEELANRIANGEIPALSGKRILAMDVDGMIAGTKYRGMFEERCKAVLSYCASQEDAIVFIDEVHKIMGAGGNTEGGMNLGNLMKTYLTKGTSIIGATTYDEYNNLKKDAALTRRFGIIPIEEQEPEVVKWILGIVKDKYAEYHNVKITDKLIDAIVDTFDQKNYNTAGIDYAKNALDSICTIMEIDGSSQSEAYAEFIDGQKYDKEENNEYIKKEKLGFGVSNDSGIKKRPKGADRYIEILKEEEDIETLGLLSTADEAFDLSFSFGEDEDIQKVNSEDEAEYEA